MFKKDIGFDKMSDMDLVFIMLFFGLLGVAIDFTVWYYFYSVSLMYVKYTELFSMGGDDDDKKSLIKNMMWTAKCQYNYNIFKNFNKYK